MGFKLLLFIVNIYQVIITLSNRFALGFRELSANFADTNIENRSQYAVEQIYLHNYINQAFSSFLLMACDGVRQLWIMSNVGNA